MGINLGDTARDTVTGFEGVVISKTKWLHGCERLQLQPQELKDGKPIESASFDEPQLELIKSAVVKGSSNTGGPRPEPKQKSI